MGTPAVDFFVSYTSADRPWAEWIAWELESAGYVTRVQAWDFAAGSNFVLEMHQAARVAQRTIAVLSPAFLESPYASGEWAAAFRSDPMGTARGLVPVRVRACEPDGLLGAVVYVDVVGLTEARARARLLAGVTHGRAKPAHAPRFPGAEDGRVRLPQAGAAIFSVPVQTRTFVGRERILKQLWEGLWGGDAVAVAQACVIHGIGGVGKTQLAARYARVHRDAYDVVWWLRAERPDTLYSDLAGLAVALGLATAADVDVQAGVDAARCWLERSARWLVVVDNAFDPAVIAELIPEGAGGHVLITSRAHGDWRALGATPLAVGVWQRAESIAFLAARTGQHDDEALHAVAAALGDLPLALEQAAAYTNTHEITLAAYADRLREGAAQQFAARPHADEYVAADEPSTVPQASPLALRSARVRAPFVGREAELDALRGLFEEPGAGRGRLALLEGEPGIGKTRLSVQFAQECERTGALTLYGRCDPETVVPYQPFVEALRAAHSAGVLGPLRERMPTHLAELARVLPELAETAGLTVPALGTDDTTERYRLFDAVATVLAQVARARRMLLILDDLHWADKATLQMLRQVIRSAGDAPMLMLGTYRDTERGDALLDALADLHREHVLYRISLSGLDEGNAGALIEQLSDRDVSSQLSRTLWKQCRGNPFFLEEMIRNDRGEDPATGNTDALPRAIADVISRRLARLSPQACTILEIACVAGNRFSIEIVERLGDMAEDVLDSVLCETIEAHLIEEVPGVYGRFAFEHELIRQTLYERLTRTRRARLHLRVAQALEEQSTEDVSRLAELAYHYLHAPPSQGREQAGRYAVLAARHALDVLAFEEAVRHYRVALSVLTAKTDAERRDELLLALGDAQFKAGDARGARVTFREASETARAIGSASGFAKAALGRAQAFEENVVTLLEQALNWLGDDDLGLQCRLLLCLVGQTGLARDPARCSVLSEQAIAVSRRTDDCDAVSAALAVRRWSLWTPEDIDERRQITTELLRLAASAGSTRLAIEGQRWRLIDLFELGDIDGARTAVEAFAALAQERRLPSELWWMRIFRAVPPLLEGRYPEAEEHSRAGSELGNRVGDPSAGAVFTLQMITIRRDRGGLEQFEDDVRAYAARHPTIPGWRCVLAHLLCEAGRLDEARQELDVVAAGRFAVLPRDGLWLGALAYSAEVAAQVGAHAPVLYELLKPFPDRNIAVGWTAACLGSSSRLLALLAATLGRHDDASTHFANALTMNERMGAAPWLARTRVEYGQFLLAHRSADDHERAVALVKQGLDTARRLGMTPLANSATRMLDQHRRARRRPRSS